MDYRIFGGYRGAQEDTKWGARVESGEEVKYLGLIGLTLSEIHSQLEDICATEGLQLVEKQPPIFQMYTKSVDNIIALRIYFKVGRKTVRLELK